MIQIQIWKHSLLLYQETVATEREADRIVDWLIHSVHNGNLGTGRYKIDADRVDLNSLFVGSYLHTPWFSYPVAEQAAAD